MFSNLDPYILAFSAITVVVTIWMGFRSAKTSKTASDFFVAGRSVSVGWNASAISGEYLSAASFMGIAGMVMQNPNSPALKPVGADLPELDRDNPVVVKILTVLEQSVNPAIAAHGGRADLVAIEDDVAYLRLSGGCQGCGMAAATLREGIEVAILEAVPEITRVADVTDHANGANPYYTASH